ncbi:carbohydrate-binding family 9-like protein [Chitinophaga sp. GbtcB8]|uniref:carbohydrate-binding family 9-like protein n=1 Tax=Chitinophaga sp. GbtcB8 TaxID=2824753 RepID=UPI001C2FFB39|nr:carbohydrate-binding family 9-like protein [Chitinophaga sp. GbtcB8]
MIIACKWMLVLACICCSTEIFAQQLSVIPISDFKVTGDGSNAGWNQASWITLPQRSGQQQQSTKVKALYSNNGIYFLFHCEDQRLSAAMKADFLDLWTEDVAEVFLWPDTLQPAYFEYEISPLNYELPILISNEQGDLVRWLPFHYDADRKTQHATTVSGGEKKSGAALNSWTAEFFIPFKLLRPLRNIVPRKGTTWKVNLYRVDYDKDAVEWSWQLTGSSFHEIEKFGRLVFE